MSRARSRERRTQRESEWKRIGERARERIPELVQSNRIRELCVELTDDVLFPDMRSRGINFCVVCGKHERFRLHQHLTKRHPELAKETDDFKVVEQVSRGITEAMKKASVDVSKVRRPVTASEYEIYKELIDQIRAGGIPVYGHYDPPGPQPTDSVMHAISDLREELLVHRQLATTSAPGPSGLALQVRPPIPSNVPPTYSAPLIPRAQTYLVPLDELYLGEFASVVRATVKQKDEKKECGPHAHQWFTAPPKLNLMFLHEWDDHNHNYTEQQFTIVGNRRGEQGWMRNAEKKLKLWRKVKADQHKLIQLFRFYIEEAVLLPAGNDMDANDPSLTTSQNYVSYICRFMLVAMRSRQRLGRQISMDDAIYSSAILLHFFEVLKRNGVPTTTRMGFVKALASFYEFLRVNMGSDKGQDRLQELKQASHRARHILSKLKSEDKKLQSYRGVLPSRKPQKPEEPYCVARAIVTHTRVIEEMKRIYVEYERSLTISSGNYNYYTGALMSYIVHCNTARNECVYKMLYGSVFPPADRESSDTPPRSGVQKATIPSGDGESEEFWVGVYPKGKNVDAVRDQTTFHGNFFVLDQVSLELVALYDVLRVAVAERNGLHKDEVQQPTSKFFLNWFAKPFGKTHTIKVMQRFLKNTGCGDLNISCNTSRHRTAKLQFERYLKRSYEELRGGVDPACAILSGHKATTQLQYYNDSYVMACAYAYRRLRHYANREARMESGRMRLIESKVQIARFRARAEREEEEVAVEGPLSQEDERERGDHGSSTSNGSEVGGSEDERPITPLSSEAESSDYEPPARKRVSTVASTSSTSQPRRSQRPKRPRIDPYQFVESSSSLSSLSSESPPSRRRTQTRSQQPQFTEPEVPEPQVPEQSPPVPPLVSESGDDDLYDLDEEEMERRQRCAADVGDEGEGESDDESVTTQSVECEEGTTTAVATAATTATTTTTTPTTTTPTTTTPTTATVTTGVRCQTRNTEESPRNGEQPCVEETAAADEVTLHLQRLNDAEYTGGLSTFATEFERRDFMRRRQEQPVQDFTWLQIREIPGIGGRGVFAKVPIPKDAVVCDYRGLVLEEKEANALMDRMGKEEREHVEAYLVQYTGRVAGHHFRHVIFGHHPTYKGTVVIGRLVNHTRLHPNLTLRDLTTMVGGKVQSMIYFKAMRDIRAGEQLLWNYGKEYNVGRLRASCICNDCDPALVQESSAELRPAIDNARAIPVVESQQPSRDVSLSQRMPPAPGTVARRAPLGVSELLLSAAHKAKATGFVVDEVGTDAFSAYERSRRVVFGPSDEVRFTVDIPLEAAATNLSRAFAAARKDAYQRYNPAIVVLKRTARDRRPTVVLVGAPLAPSSEQRYGSCVVYVGSEDRVYAVREQKESTAEPAIDEEFVAGTLLRFPAENDWPPELEAVLQAGGKLQDLLDVLQKYKSR
ncbi:hypothetical protein RB195_026561 [Necator americanus]|uniref:SET domain-containing protein n=1 Tax=Necator americanus TaxID=51031 RepID=A0ABR1EXI5_NECAM